jgi:Cu2+-containing amine oxidase
VSTVLGCNRALTLRKAVLTLLAALCVSSCLRAAEHPLDPLSQDEIATAVSVLKAEGKATQQSLFLCQKVSRGMRAECCCPVCDEPEALGLGVPFE